MRTFTLLLLLLLSIVPTTWGQCTENRSTATDTTWDIQTKLNSLPSIWTPVQAEPPACGDCEERCAKGAGICKENACRTAHGVPQPNGSCSGPNGSYPSLLQGCDRAHTTCFNNCWNGGPCHR